MFPLQDANVRAWSFFALCCLKNFQNLIDCGAVPVLVELLESPDVGVVDPALRAVCLASRGSTGDIDALVEAGIIPCLATLRESSNSEVQLLAQKTINNITASVLTQVR